MASVTWDVVTGESDWGVSIIGFTTTGTINVMPWPSKPNSMETPNTANPGDGGNVQDKAGDHNDFRFAIQEMKCKELDGKLTTAWNAVPDDPGLAGSNGYDAGQAVLDGLITKVEAYAATKGWK